MSTSRDLLKTLVGFDTTSRESNLQLIAFVRDYLEGFEIMNSGKSGKITLDWTAL